MGRFFGYTYLGITGLSVIHLVMKLWKILQKIR